MSLFDSKNVKITQVEVENPNLEATEDFTNAQNLPEVTDSVSETPVTETPIVQPRIEEQTRTQTAFQDNRRGEKPKKYNWAFFVACMFMGIGLSKIVHNPAMVMMGMSVGFLFFVDPIYQKVMDKIEKW